jgi:hypothetical protein
MILTPEPEFVNVYRSQESIPPDYVATSQWRAGTITLLVAQARQATETDGIDSWAP